MTTALAVLTGNLAKQFNMGDGTDLVATLKATCFKGSTQITDAQMTALLVVAQQYGLNPFTKEIFAFPDKGGIVPVVGVDGWARIINSHAQYDGMDFAQDENSCTCTIHRKDRGHPTRVTEYMVECKRNGVGPWMSHPYRMLRHKSMIQCARLAFGFAGIYEQDEAERIIESLDVSLSDAPRGKPTVAMPQAKAAAAERPAADVTDVVEKPAQRPTQSASNGALASPGEVAYITKRIDSRGWSIAAAMEAAGMPGVETLDGLTKDGFVSLRDATK